MADLKQLIKYEDFSKIEVRIGTILSCENVAGSTKLLKLDVDFGNLGKRQILTGMAEWYKPADFMGLQTTFVINIEPRKMMGLESQGMLFAVDGADGKPVFLKLADKTKNGMSVI